MNVLTEDKHKGTITEDLIGRPLTALEINYIKSIALNDVEKQKYPSFQELNYLLKKGDLLLGSTYHELGHLKVATEHGLNFDYLRLGKRVFYLDTQNNLQTIVLKRLQDNKKTGCIVMHIPDDQVIDKKAYQAMIIGGPLSLDMAFEVGDFSDKYRKMKKEQHPNPKNPYSDEFLKVAETSEFSDEWLWWQLENNENRAIKMNKMYKSVGMFLRTSDLSYLKDIGLLHLERRNFINVAKMTN